MNEKHRSCIEAPLYTRQKAQIQPDAQRFAEVEELYEHRVATHPETYPVIAGTPGWRRVQTRAGIGGCPALDMYFAVEASDDQCEWKAVETATTKPSITTIFDRER